jgi:hypothetical protein
LLGRSREYVRGRVTRPEMVRRKKGKNCPCLRLARSHIKLGRQIIYLVVIIVIGGHLDGAVVEESPLESFGAPVAATAVLI